jgi:hypothetical protein
MADFFVLGWLDLLRHCCAEGPDQMPAAALIQGHRHSRPAHVLMHVQRGTLTSSTMTPS